MNVHLNCLTSIVQLSVQQSGQLKLSGQLKIVRNLIGTGHCPDSGQFWLGFRTIWSGFRTICQDPDNLARQGSGGCITRLVELDSRFRQEKTLWFTTSVLELLLPSSASMYRHQCFLCIIYTFFLMIGLNLRIMMFGLRLFELYIRFCLINIIIKLFVIMLVYQF